MHRYGALGKSGGLGGHHAGRFVEPVGVAQPIVAGQSVVVGQPIGVARPVTIVIRGPELGASVGACTSSQLRARIVPLTPASSPAVQAVLGWQGAAGSRFADIELANTSPACTMPSLLRLQLVDGHGTVLIDGPAPGSSSLLTVGAGAILKTVVRVANYCGPAPGAPVTVEFRLPGSAGRIHVPPVSATDLDAVPPCNGASASADIEMHPLAP